MRVMGLWDGRDASAAIVEDGRLVFAAAEERFTLVWLQAGFPERAMRAALDHAGIEPRDIDIVALAGRAGRFLPRALEAGTRRPPRTGKERPLLKGAWRKIESAISRSDVLSALDAAASGALLARRLRDTGFRCPLRLVRRGGALVACASSVAGGVAVMPLTPSVISETDDMSRLFATVAGILGIDECDVEGLRSLAATGDPSRAARLFEGLLRFSGGRVLVDGAPVAGIERALQRGATRADIAVALEHRAGHVLSAFVRGQGGKTTVRVSLAGALFGNSVLAARVGLADTVEELYAFPAMGDRCLAAGAALAASGGGTAPALGLLGPDIGDCEAALRDAGLNSRKPRRMESDVARLIADGKVVGVARGRNELGSRALGNRAILLPAGSSAIASDVRRRLDMDAAEPFVPALPESLAPELLRRGSGLAAARVAALCLPAAPPLRRLCSACVRRDGTCTPQVVRASEMPFLHGVLAAVRDKTGKPAVATAPLSMPGLPPVQTAAGAIEAFLALRLDALVLGDRLVLV